MDQSLKELLRFARAYQKLSPTYKKALRLFQRYGDVDGWVQRTAFEALELLDIQFEDRAENKNNPMAANIYEALTEAEFHLQFNSEVDLN